MLSRDLLLDCPFIVSNLVKESGSIRSLCGQGNGDYHWARYCLPNFCSTIREQEPEDSGGTQGHGIDSRGTVLKLFPVRRQLHIRVFGLGHRSVCTPRCHDGFDPPGFYSSVGSYFLQPMRPNSYHRLPSTDSSPDLEAAIQGSGSPDRTQQLGILSGFAAGAPQRTSDIIENDVELGDPEVICDEDTGRGVGDETRQCKALGRFWR